MHRTMCGPCLSCAAPEPPASNNWRTKTYDVLFGARIVSKTSIVVNVVFALIILASVVVVMVDSLQSVKDDFWTSTVFNYVEIGFSLLFTGEYLLRLLCVHRCHVYMLSFMGVVDFLSAIPPLFSMLYGPLGTLILLRVIKLTRIFRLLHFVGVFRAYNELLQNVSRNTLKMVVFVIGFWSISIVLGGLMFWLESADNAGFDTIFKGIYWAIVTLTTVGYGDSVPQSPAGKVLAAVTMSIGYTLVVLGLRHFYESTRDGNGNNAEEVSDRRGTSRMELQRVDTNMESKHDADDSDQGAAPKTCAQKYQCYIRLVAVLKTIHACVTKLFLGGAGWQAFALFSNMTSNSTEFAFVTGIGDATGVFIGNFILCATLACCVRVRTLRACVSCCLMVG